MRVDRRRLTTPGIGPVSAFSQNLAWSIPRQCVRGFLGGVLTQKSVAVDTYHGSVMALTQHKYRFRHRDVHFALK